MSKTKKASLIILLGILITAILFFAVIMPARYSDEVKIPLVDGMWLKTPIQTPITNFTSINGESFTKQNLMGTWSLVYFSFDNCMQECHADLKNFSKVFANLANQLPNNKLPQIYIILVQYTQPILVFETDTQAYHNKITIVQANKSQTADWEAILQSPAINMLPKETALDRFSQKYNSKILLIDSSGQIRAVFNPQADANQLANDYIRIAAIPRISLVN